MTLWLLAMLPLVIALANASCQGDADRRRDEYLSWKGQMNRIDARRRAQGSDPYAGKSPAEILAILQTAEAARQAKNLAWALAKARGEIE